MPGLPPLAVYLHLPWCVRKCPYCDFNSHTAGADVDTGRYARALAADIAREAHDLAGRTVDTVFLGGGTPSFFPPAEIGRVLEAVRTSFSLAPDAEITMEANPGALESGRLGGYREAGVNRLSLGAQSFDDAALRRLGRIHDADRIRRAFREARDAGFDNVNLDLMFALPGQDLAGAAADLEEAVRLAPEHISRYQLTLEPNTRFYAAPPAGLPDEDLAFEMQERGGEVLELAGYEQYEVSAWARPGRRCRHNLNYWLFGDYVGAGAGYQLNLSGWAQAHEGLFAGALVGIEYHITPSIGVFLEATGDYYFGNLSTYDSTAADYNAAYDYDAFYPTVALGANFRF